VATVSVPFDTSPLPTGRRGSAIGATDGELLMRFVRHDDEQAFAEIVERHGRLVWMVCHQILQQRQDVEDAFQATFLILAQRAHVIRATDSAAAWLFKVAQRTAMAARRKRARRREESLVAEPPQGEEALPMIHDRQMRYVLLDELRGLPPRYQTPLVLRYLEGQSRRAIAEQTDSTIGQVQGRIARGRRMLRSRLVRRGVSLSLAAGTIGGVSANASAAVTPALVSATATSCLALKTSGAAGGASSAALELAREGVKAMWYASITKPAAAVATLLLAAGILLAAKPGNGAAENPAASRATEGVELQALAADSAEPGIPTTVAIAAAPKKEHEEADSDREDELKRLMKAIAELRDRSQRHLDSKVEEAAKLEMEQLAKTLLQREVEQVHGTLVQLRLPQVTQLGKETSQEEIQNRTELREILEQKFEELTDELESLMRRTAKRSVEMEQVRLEVARSQRLIDELSRRHLQMEFAPTMAPATTASPAAADSSWTPIDPNTASPVSARDASLATNPFAPQPTSEQQFRQAIMQELAALKQSINALSNENARLRQLHNHDNSQPAASDGKSILVDPGDKSR